MTWNRIKWWIFPAAFVLSGIALLITAGVHAEAAKPHGPAYQPPLVLVLVLIAFFWLTLWEIITLVVRMIRHRPKS